MIPLPFQAGQAGRTQKQWSPAISMDFEGANGSSTFTDDSRFGTTWTRSGANVTISTATILQGTSSLLVNGSADYLEANATSDILLPATDDFELRFKYNMTNGAGRYLMDCSDASASAAGSQFRLYCSQSGGTGSASNHLFFYLSDGTTYNSVINTSGVVSQGATHSLVLRREGQKLFLLLDNQLDATATLTLSINQPSGRKFRLGKPAITGESGPNTIYFDDFRLLK